MPSWANNFPPDDCLGEVGKVCPLAVRLLLFNAQTSFLEYLKFPKVTMESRMSTACVSGQRERGELRQKAFSGTCWSTWFLMTYFKGKYLSCFHIRNLLALCFLKTILVWIFLIDCKMPQPSASQSVHRKPAARHTGVSFSRCFDRVNNF